jgi:ParB family chromosome partitioning protein
MDFEQRDIADLTPDPLNSRKHDSRNLDAICKSLTRFGQQKPIVIDANGVIRAGNGTCEAAKLLGWETIGVVVSALEGADLVAYGIADNKSGDLASWDYEPLSEMLAELQDRDPELVSATGFSADELDALLSADWTPPEPTGENPARTDKKTLTLSDASWDAVTTAMKLAREKSETELTDDQAIQIVAAAYVTAGTAE